MSTKIDINYEDEDIDMDNPLSLALQSLPMMGNMDFDDLEAFEDMSIDFPTLGKQKSSYQNIPLSKKNLSYVNEEEEFKQDEFH